MAPALKVGLNPIPAADPLIEVSGLVRFTAIKIAAPPFIKGKLSIYEENGQYSLGLHGKTFRLFKLSNNIRNYTSRSGQITIVLLDGFQVLAKECAHYEIELLDSCLSSIKSRASLKGWSNKKKEHSSSSDDQKHSFLETSKKLIKKIKKTSPFSSQKKNVRVASPLSETTSKSPMSRRNQLEKVKGRLLDSPLSNKENANGNGSWKSEHMESMSIEDEEVRMITTPKQTGSWSRPPGEQQSQSPVLRTKSPKSKKRLIDQNAFSPEGKIPHIIDDFDDENWSSSASKTPKTYKRTYSSKKSASPSPLRPKVLQGENNMAIEDAPTGQDVTLKASSFYGTSKPSLFSSITGNKFRIFNWMGKGLKRQLPVPSQEKDSTKLSFKKKETAFNENKQLALTGFANLGNTCYMNAILQCLLGTPVFAHDLSNPFLLQNVPESSLYKYLHKLALAKRNNEDQEKQRLILRNVKRVISNQATRFSGYMQHDAHEFLGQCLDQLKDDIIKSVLPKDDDENKLDNEDTEERKARESACPVARNFECQIAHTIKCDECGNQITKEEVFYDFSLDIPEIDENTDPDDKDIQELLQDYFEEESIGYKCEKCECENASLSHHISKLPRVMILHLKRYELNEDFSKYRKKLDTVDVPLEINLGVLCTDKTKKPLHFDRTPKGGIKRPISNESPDDLNDFQPSYKARRKLSLPAIPVLSDPENDDSGLKFERDIEKAKQLSLDTATEEEQLEWALAESMKTGQQYVGGRLIQNDDYLPPSILQIDPLSRSRNENGDERKNHMPSTETFTGLREKSKQPVETEISEASCDRIEKRNTDFSEWLSTHERATEKEDDSALMEGLSQLENEDDQLKMALELSLKEYNEKSAQKPKLTQMQCKSNSRINGSSTKKKRKVAADIKRVARKYRLIGLVSHIGDSSVAGHYISDVYDCKGNEWKSYNDINVDKITEYQVRYGRKRSAYIFFYIDEECFKVIKSK